MAESWFWACPVAYNNVIYVGCLDHKVYALDIGSGDKVAELDLGSPICSSPVLVDDKVIIATEEGIVYALDTSNNQKKWDIDLGEKIYAPLCASNGVVYIHTHEHETIYARRAQTGAKIWTFPISSK